MGQIDESKTTPKMAKTPSAVKKSSSTKAKGGAGAPPDAGSGFKLDVNDPKIQAVLVVVLLLVLGIPAV
ncbi:hypothetical protein SFRURICE_004516 [Spodoptera frugiperda]|uniref:SFRICE_001143 n=1 Tax=Spodoptera frugiperda TaxID=7108 RepID=A0A2H1WYF2_SPOFR|nr:hypothetical protein SFRURICE_004516 [Spodoptera frugiperda]